MNLKHLNGLKSVIIAVKPLNEFEKCVQEREKAKKMKQNMNIHIYKYQQQVIALFSLVVDTQHIDGGCWQPATSLPLSS